MNRDERRDPERSKENITEIPEHKGMRRGKLMSQSSLERRQGRQIGEKPQVVILREPGGRQALWYANRHHR